ncbi:MAG: formylglycine-generating enzyme family protein, partial [Candidatus Brocadiia bacterium]
MFRPVFVLMILACFLLPAFLPAEDAAQVKGPIALVQVKAGSFKMGSEDGYREKPIHLVTLSHAFFIGAKEVTQAQYKAVMGENPSEFKGDDLPVDSVSWYDAMKFCSKLTESERKNGHLPKEMEYRLPTEAEWEYCCRAGSTSKFCVGDDDALLGDYAWSKENSEEKTHPVGGKKPNDWGIYDMHGNVYEYCLDWFEEVYRAEDQTDPIAAAKMENRVFRGGSWNNEAQYCRSSIRRSCDPVSKSEYTGFRVVVAVGNLGVDALKVEETWRNEALRTPLV